MAANVCVIGQTVAQQLFGNDDPIGKVMRISNLPFLVEGELASKGESTFGHDQDDIIIAPYTTVQKKLSGISWVNYINASAISDDAIQPAIQQVSALLRHRHKLRPQQADDFMIPSRHELADTATSPERVTTALLGSMVLLSPRFRCWWAVSGS